LIGAAARRRNDFVPETLIANRDESEPSATGRLKGTRPRPGERSQPVHPHVEKSAVRNGRTTPLHIMKKFVAEAGLPCCIRLCPAS